ncbi:FG-GAP repeat domain-containing protein [Maribacter halichondriae]|uniref:FG-GAP repeat domain-containing protein n=1 Tax=Maribacter halichondriae TaxID=2980554 RepID=UPI002358D7EE|nr:VCBS repeat-containing protein [Maribacter sp. Hal144]
MKVVTFSFSIFFMLGLSARSQEVSVDSKINPPLQFEKKKIASESFESVGVLDVNGDKIPDLISGSYWYEGPDYLERHFITDFKRYDQYYDDFSTLPLDVNGDGLMDYITGGWFAKRLVWMENPGDNNAWTEHLIADAGNIEATRIWDIDGDGISEIVPNTPNDSLIVYRLKKDAQGKNIGEFEAFPITGKHDHGLGFGDVNGDGRGDLITSKGWLEAPEKPFEGKWLFHSDFDFDKASIPIIVVDVNKDGRNDIIVGQAHDYGLHWYEQKQDKKGILSWAKHDIDPYNSQFHTMQWADLDGDGNNELITGKRYRAHSGNDPGSNDPYGLYYYKFNGENFVKQIIDYGVFGSGKGTGIHFVVTDLNASGLSDIVVAGKDGLYIYFNRGHAK